MLPRSIAYAAVLILPISACSAPMDLTAHISEGNTSFTGSLNRAANGTGTLVFSAPGGPSCDGIIVPNTLSAPERAEGQIQCTDGRSGAIRMYTASGMTVGSGRLGRDTITFRAITRAPMKDTQSAAPLPSAKMKTGPVTLQELYDAGLAPRP